MKAKTAARLGLQGRTERVAIRTIDGQKKPMDREVVNFSIASLDGYYSFDIVDAHVMETFELYTQSIDLSNLVKRWAHLGHVPIHSIDEEDVSILIGQDHPAPIEIFETRKDPFYQRAPRAYLTAFGWCIGGPSGQIGDSDGNCYVCMYVFKAETGNCYHLSLTEDRCDAILQQFIETDTFGTKPNVVKPVSPDEKRAWIILKETTKHNG